MPGSSPLARGLRQAGHGPGARPRIIPARAGFTSGFPVGSGGVRDHPRSRGVYRLELGERGEITGSSPLARGLHAEFGGVVPRLRIIPARAGFTTAPTRTSVSGPDHPRSRGVYGPVPVEAPPLQGSSPLARGLHHHALPFVIIDRIIPARAGFTMSINSYGAPLSDHPRSRGVYAKLYLNSLYGKGSSPLARGLRALTSMSATTSRIIPARAGFTFHECDGLFVGEDHPRSRGVY